MFFWKAHRLQWQGRLCPPCENTLLKLFTRPRSRLSICCGKNTKAKSRDSGPECLSASARMKVCARWTGCSPLREDSVRPCYSSPALTCRAWGPGGRPLARLWLCNLSVAIRFPTPRNGFPFFPRQQTNRETRAGRKHESWRLCEDTRYSITATK